MSGKVGTVYKPEEVASRLGGISVAQLVAILKDKGYRYVELKPGSKPWGRGRQVWGMTEDQIAEVIAGQIRQHPRPADALDAPASPKLPRDLAALGHDGVSRIRYPKARAKPKR